MAVSIQKKLVRWFSKHQRALPWRLAVADPYKTWLSEMMLQQTTVVTVMPYYKKFIARWPDVAALAGARQSSVLAAWAGLGYYSRARNLHAAAQKIMRDYDGVFPRDVATLKTLPGVGDYSAGAIAAIAFDAPAAAVDGNVMRVMARFYGLSLLPVPLKKQVQIVAQKWMDKTPKGQRGQMVQALMELGAMVCRPRAPQCDACPLAADCVAQRDGLQASLPVRPIKKAIPRRVINCFLLRNKQGDVFIVRRPAHAMLGGMWGLPITALTDKEQDDDVCTLPLQWVDSGLVAVHVFSHFTAELHIYSGVASAALAKKMMASKQGQFVSPAQLAKKGLPTLFTKVLTLAGIVPDSALK